LNESPRRASPDGWKNGNEAVYVEEVDGERIAHGPDGADYRLIERTGERRRAASSARSV
jgi:hypothetical protein